MEPAIIEKYTLNETPDSVFNINSSTNSEMFIQEKQTSRLLKTGDISKNLSPLLQKEV